MDFLFQIQNQWNVEIALAFVFEGESVDDACHFLQLSAPWLTVAPAWRDFRGNSSELTMTYGPASMEISRVMLIGLGEEKKLSAKSFRHSFAKALVKCREMGLEHIGIDMVSVARIATRLNIQKEDLAKELTVAAHLALYRYNKFKQKPEKAQPEIRKISFLLDDNYCDDKLKDAVRFGEAEAGGICLARNLGNAPSNHLTPKIFAEKAEEVCKEYNFTYKVLNEKELEAENMHTLLAVGKGSAQESHFVIIEYKPNEEKTEKIALVGKGITFDTGGISLKPSAGMGDMKGDMSGAGAVLGTMECLGQLSKLGVKPKYNIIAILPLVENMPDGNAIKPGDVVYAKNGKSIEIANTDAEGRLILADALVYTEEKYSPKYILDIATLTGACAIALGNGAAGVFSNNDEIAQKLTTFGNTHFETSWHLPLWEHFMESMKSNVADFSNVGTREGGALFAAMFLKQFVNTEKTWVHIDMAAADNGDDPVTPKGSTGYGVRMLTNFALMD